MMVPVVAVSVVVAMVMTVGGLARDELDTLLPALTARVLGEQERLHRDRHGERRQPDLAEID
ncbi:MAG TPA: hypothetical protein VK862_01645, partial [Afifellaceae bacterium]|nr:hypothetical protein [Afifellaceae bacterium]